MDGQLRDVMDAVERLSVRVGAIERRLGMNAPAVQEPAQRTPEPTTESAVAPATPHSTHAHHAEAASAPPLAPPTVSPLTSHAAAPHSPPVAQAPVRVAPPTRAPGVHAPAVKPARAASGESGMSLERLVGGRLYAIAGALILIVGIGLFLKLGIDRGWFTLPPAIRCIAGAVMGMVLIGAGEVVRRRLKAHGDFVASGLAAAGLASMYASVLVARGVYDLIPAAGAFGLFALISALGIGLALRAGSLVLAILALVGAYLNPIAAQGTSSDPAIMPAYLIALMIVGLVLAWWRPRPFRWLRSVVWIGHALFGLVWLGTIGHKHEWLALGFLGVTWALVHAELLFGARRLPEGSALGASLGLTPSSAVRVTLPMVSSFGATLYCVGLGVLVTQFGGSGALIQGWWVTTAGFVGTVLMGIVLAGNLRVLRDPPESDSERLGVALFAQAGALLIATIALGLSNWTQVLAWLGMGIAAVTAGRWAGARAVMAYGYLVLLIATARLIGYDAWASGPATTPMLGVMAGRWSVLMALGGASWISAAMLTRKHERAQESGLRAAAVDVALAIGMTLPIAGLMNDKGDAVVLIPLVGVLGAGIAWVSRWRGSVGLGVYALVVLLAACAAVEFRYAVNFDGGWEAYTGAALTHPGLMVSIVVGVLGLLAAGALVSPEAWRVRVRALRRLIIGLVGVLLFAAASLEIARSAALWTSDRTAQGAAVSIFWALVSVGMIAYGFLRRQAIVRHIGLGLLGVAAAKTVVFDLQGVAPEWRIASLIGVGLLMLLVALGYARVAARLKEDPPPA